MLTNFIPVVAVSVLYIQGGLGCAVPLPSKVVQDNTHIWESPCNGHGATHLHQDTAICSPEIDGVRWVLSRMNETVKVLKNITYLFVSSLYVV